jgi:CheY-like chemotaxis protein
MLRVMLEAEGHRVHVAPDGPTGVETAHTPRPDIALIDIGLPGFDGYEVGRRIRNELGTSIRLVAVTGYGQDDDRRRRGEAGFDAHIVKPVTPEQLRAVLLQGSPTPGSPREVGVQDNSPRPAPAPVRRCADSPRGACRPSGRAEARGREPSSAMRIAWSPPGRRFDAHLVKPVPPEQLCDALLQTLSAIAITRRGDKERNVTLELRDYDDWQPACGGRRDLSLTLAPISRDDLRLRRRRGQCAAAGVRAGWPRPLVPSTDRPFGTSSPPPTVKVVRRCITPGAPLPVQFPFNSIL